MNPTKPAGWDKIIKKLDQEVQTWSQGEVFEVKKKFTDEYFTKNIKGPAIIRTQRTDINAYKP